jgi:hypothetical protein
VPGVDLALNYPSQKLTENPDPAIPSSSASRPLFISVSVASD